MRGRYISLLILNFFCVGNAFGMKDLSPTIYLEQNWSDQERQGFYYAPQGSHLMPYEWALQLRNTRNQDLFFLGRGLERYGYLAQAPSRENPDGLPIGFTQDSSRGQKTLGMNCAACHTSNIQAGTQLIRIDGGPTRADFQNFVKEMDETSARTLNDPVLFELFARNLLGQRYSTREVQKLRVEMGAYVNQRKEWQERNSSSLAYGPGRNDAFGVIFNQVLADSLNIPANRREPNAPVSYPVLWDTNQHDLVQWVGIASNAPDKGGALSRNIGQVLGVFGHVDTSRRTLVLNGFCSSARRTHLDELEEASKSLWSPQWPEAQLGELKQDLVARGREVYGSKCVGCHSEINRADPNRQITAHMVPIDRVGTDPLTAHNAARRTALTGTLEGAPVDLVGGRPMEKEEPAAMVLKHVVAGSMAGTISPITCRNEFDSPHSDVLAGWRRVTRRAISNLFTSQESQLTLPLEERMTAQIQATEKYKARPLNGVWASGPYLHNGSVPTLYEMLLPAAQRSAKFRVGCAKFNSERVGFDCESDQGSFEFDTSLPGNSNQGHEFAASLNESDRLALLEYLKSL